MAAAAQRDRVTGSRSISTENFRRKKCHTIALRSRRSQFRRSPPLWLRYTRGGALPCRGPSKVGRYTPATATRAGRVKSLSASRRLRGRHRPNSAATAPNRRRRYRRHSSRPDRRQRASARCLQALYDTMSRTLAANARRRVIGVDSPPLRLALIISLCRPS
jgi:hypothetical protein